MTHGMKSLAKELPKHGRYGDTIVAHINPQEAALLKSLGGSGTINPTTGLPEFFGGLGALNPLNKGSAAGKLVGSIPGVKEAQNLATTVFQPVEKAVVQPASRGLVSLDKAVGKAIPGGWGTLGMAAASFIPGMTPLMMGGLGAINGSGVLRPGGKFNMQGAIMGGVTAYGMAELSNYAQVSGGGDGSAGTSIPTSATPPASLPVSEVPIGDFAGSLSDPTAGMAAAYTPPAPPGVMSNIASGNFSEAANQVGANIGSAVKSGYNSGADLLDKATTGSTYSNLAKGYGENVSDFGAGLKNLATGSGGTAASEAVKAGTLTSPAMAAGATLYGGTGMMAVEEQRKYLEEAKKANAISEADYNAKLADINRQADIARRVTAEHPFGVTSKDISIGDTYYGRTGASDTAYDRADDAGVTLYAAGGDVDGQLSLADYMMTNSNQTSSPLKLASGGMPRFLSGGGDGMSDSIHASIGGSQPARLADGEFVIPADVVSHLGNGSSKAGAKRLYKMMDKVRVARTGRKQQGKQINPMKYMPA